MIRHNTSCIRDARWESDWLGLKCHTSKVSTLVFFRFLQPIILYIDLTKPRLLQSSHIALSERMKTLAKRPLRPPYQLRHAQGPEKDKKDEGSEQTEHKNQAALVAGAEKMSPLTLVEMWDNVVKITIMNHPFLGMVYTNHLWWFRGWFIMILTTWLSVFFQSNSNQGSGSSARVDSGWRSCRRKWHTALDFPTKIHQNVTLSLSFVDLQH